MTSLSKGMAIAGAIVIPPGLAISGILGGFKGLASGFVGFTIASLHSVALVYTLSFAIGNPRFLTSILSGGYFLRIILLAGVLYGLHFVKALDMIPLLGCFLALFIAHSVVEITCVVKSYGVALRGFKESGKKQEDETG